MSEHRCAYCGMRLTKWKMPATLLNDEEFAAVAKEHRADCQWVKARGVGDKIDKDALPECTCESKSISGVWKRVVNPRCQLHGSTRRLFTV